MIEIGTAFPYLGERDYIHGTSILAGFIDALEARGHRDIAVKRLKFQRPAKSNGRLILTTDNLDAREAENANCTFVGTVHGTVWRGRYTESGAAVTERLSVSYPIENLQAKGFGGSCLISPESRDDLIRALVEANKRFHEASLSSKPGTAVRFGYLESWAAPASEIRFSGRLDAANLIARKTDNGYMTVNRLTYTEGEGRPVSLTLCFNVTQGSMTP